MQKIIIYQNNTHTISDYISIFDLNLEDGLIIARLETRSETQYDSDTDPSKTALKYFSTFSIPAFKLFLLVSSPDMSLPTRVRSKKGVLWGSELLRTSIVTEFEIMSDSGYSRLGALVNLKEFQFNHSEKWILNRWSSILIFTNLDDFQLIKIAKQLLSKDYNSIIGLDYSIVMQNLPLLKTTAFIKYHAADNGNNESINILCNKEFYHQTIENLLMMLKV